jgi:hypothetical protein
LGLVKALFAEFICFAFDMDTALARIAVAVTLDLILNVFDSEGGQEMSIHEKGMGTEVLRGPGLGIHVGDGRNKGDCANQE